MRQNTLDILDSELRAGYKRYSSATAIDQQLFFSRNIQVDPVQWEKLKAYFSSHHFQWADFRYCEVVDHNDLDGRIQSDSPGLYIFSAKPEVLVAGFPSFALYAGISNDHNSNRPLRERLKDYFRLNTVKKRRNVHQMLQLYYPNIWVSYTLLNWSTLQLKELEANLHEYLGVPFGTQAYTPESKSAHNAWDR